MDTLPACLEHLERQSFLDFEVIVVDDGSTDDTPAFLERYLDLNRLRMRCVRQENGGPASARNRAITATEAPLCILIGDDILVSPGFIASHRAFHASTPAPNAVAVGLTSWSETAQTVTPFMRWLEHSQQFDYAALLRGVRPTWQHFYTSNLSFKTDLLVRHPFDERFTRAMLEDAELGYRILQREGLELHFLPEAFAEHVHPMSLRKSCARAREIGRMSLLLEYIWPALAPQKSPPRLALHTFLGRRECMITLFTWFTDKLTRRWCPNPLLQPLHLLHRLAGRYGEA